jgi:hypothetical protein
VYDEFHSLGHLLIDGVGIVSTPVSEGCTW